MIKNEITCILLWGGKCAQCRRNSPSYHHPWKFSLMVVGVDFSADNGDMMLLVAMLHVCTAVGDTIWVC